MTHSFTFKDSREIEINDVRNPQVFCLPGYRYEVTIKPKCTFWRIGMRLWLDNRSPGYSETSRYNNNQIRHIEISAGIRSNDVWLSPNVLQLQQYHIPETGSTLASIDDYDEQSDVKVSLFADSSKKKIEITISTQKTTRNAEVDVGFYQSFQIWGWADYTPFEIETSVDAKLIPLEIDLKNLKALSLLVEQKKFTLEELTIFFGANNSGKTSMLIAACSSQNSTFYSTVDYIGTNRVYSNTGFDIHLDGLSDHEKESRQGEGRRQRIESKPGQNQTFDWMIELALQDEATRAKIFSWIALHFERWELHEIKTGKFVTGIETKVNNASPLDQGTGVRAILPIVIQLYNPKIDILAIDEPEHGLEPRMQKVLFRAIKDASEGRNGFPLKRILLATHSHLFLDRAEIKNNFRVKKVDGIVDVQQIQDVEELREVTFNLLGNNPSDLFFPSNVIIVEGVSDKIFLEGIYKVGKAVGDFTSENLAFHYLEGIDKLKLGSEAAVQMLKTQSYSPVYKERVCGIFDKTHKTGMINSVRKYFGDRSNERFVLLEEEAIEYFYPLSIVNKEFDQRLSPSDFKKEVDSFLASVSKHSNGQFLGQNISKKALAARIANQIIPETLSEIHPTILELLKTADKLAFKDN